MDSLKRISSDGRSYEYLLLDPVRCADGEFRCDMVVLLDGIETARRSSFGVDADQARLLASDLRTLCIESSTT